MPDTRAQGKEVSRQAPKDPWLDYENRTGELDLGSPAEGGRKSSDESCHDDDRHVCGVSRFDPFCDGCRVWYRDAGIRFP